MSANGNDELEPDPGELLPPRPALGDADPGLPATDLTRGFFHAEVDAVDLVDCGLPETDSDVVFWIGDPLRGSSAAAVLGLRLGLALALIGGK
jgi:hypothetical protein